jgi:hypothetical protein
MQLLLHGKIFSITQVFSLGLGLEPIPNDFVGPKFSILKAGSYPGFVFVPQ